MAIKILNGLYNSLKLNPENLCSIINKCIDKNNSIYNAFITRSIQKSQQASANSRKRFESKKSYGLLDGIPLVVKDNFCIQAERTTCGSKMLQNFLSPYTATAVEKLINAGAVIIGKTNMDEFAMGSGSSNSTFGQINNPWQDVDDKICVVGGSSGGTAAAIAAGWALAGLGTDTGGSVRIPATYSGLVGLKPTYGSVSRYGVIALMNSLDTPSIMSRFVDDAEIVFNAIKGIDIRDPTSIEYPTSDGIEDSQDIRKLVIGVPQEFHPTGLLEDILELWEDTAEYFSKIGCNVTKVSLPHIPMAGKCYSVLCCADVASNMARYDGVEYGYRHNPDDHSSLSFDDLLSKSRSDSLSSAVKERILMGNFFLLRKHRDDYFEQAQKIWKLIFDDFDEVFKKVDVLLTPVALEDAPAVGNFTVMDNRLAMVKGDVCTQPASLAGVPAITIPIRLSSRGMPIGVQLISKKYSESLLFHVAKVLEKWANFQHRFEFVHQHALNHDPSLNSTD